MPRAETAEKVGEKAAGDDGAAPKAAEDEAARIAAADAAKKAEADKAKAEAEAKAKTEAEAKAKAAAAANAAAAAQAEEAARAKAAAEKAAAEKAAADKAAADVKVVILANSHKCETTEGRKCDKREQSALIQERTLLDNREHSSLVTALSLLGECKQAKCKASWKKYQLSCRKCKVSYVVLASKEGCVDECARRLCACMRLKDVCMHAAACVRLERLERQAHSATVHDTSQLPLANSLTYQPH